MDAQAWVSTGHVVEVGKHQIDRVPEFDKRSGAHLWTWAALFRTDPTTETPMLDTENLLMITGPGCYYCEKIYSPRIATRRCTGEPR